MNIIDILPPEIIEHVLLNVSDPYTISSLRKTCTLFNYIMTKYTRFISNNDYKSMENKEVSLYWPNLTRNFNITVDYVLTFDKLYRIDIPIKINTYEDLIIIGMLSNFKKMTLRIDDIYDPLIILEFIKKYKYGYILRNDKKPIKVKRTLHDIIFKIIRKNVTRWITMYNYAVICDYPQHFTNLDYKLMNIVEVKHLITNNYKNNYINNFPLETLSIIKTEDQLDIEDYKSPDNTKHYEWIPIEKHTRSNKNYMNELSKTRFRSDFIIDMNYTLTKCTFPFRVEDVHLIIKKYPMLNTIGVYIKNHKHVNLLLTLSRDVNVVCYHWGFDINSLNSLVNYKNILLVNLNILHSAETLMDLSHVFF